VFAIVKEVGVAAERGSLDEAYLDLSGLPDPIARMSTTVKRIRDELHLDASVGIGPNKLVAKVASDAEKPRGFVVLTREQAAARFAGERVTLIPGIGPKTGERLGELGVETLGQLQAFPVERLVERFGENHGGALHDRAHFRSDGAVTEHREAKSRSVESTFDTDVRDPRRMLEVLDEQSRRLAGELQGRELAGRTIGIKVRLSDFSTYTRVRSIDAPTADPEVIAAVATALLRDNPPERSVRLLGVRVAGFERPQGEAEPLSLLPAG